MACRVLIADDVAALREIWRDMLTAVPGLEIVGEACDGAEALTLALEHRPDVLVLDLSMPRVDGLEVIRRLHAQAPEIRIVVASGFAAERLAPLALELGATAYFEKGGSPDELRAAVCQACGPAHRFAD